MNNQPQRLNNQPNLRQVMDEHAQQSLLATNCAQTGTIVSFDSSKQTATVAINMMQSNMVQNAQGQNVIELKPYPLLLDVPVIFLSGGTAAITFPIQVGDTCLLVFLDRAIDTWHTTGQANLPPPVWRFHSMSDAVALVGLHSLQNKQSDYNTTHVRILGRSGGQVLTNADVQLLGVAGGSVKVTEKVNIESDAGSKVDVEDKVRIASASQDLLSALNDFCDAVIAGVDTRGDGWNGGTMIALYLAKNKFAEVLKS